jgi:hypothetical protein
MDEASCICMVLVYRVLYSVPGSVLVVLGWNMDVVTWEDRCTKYKKNYVAYKQKYDPA